MLPLAIHCELYGLGNSNEQKFRIDKWLKFSDLQSHYKSLYDFEVRPFRQTLADHILHRMMNFDTTV